MRLSSWLNAVRNRLSLRSSLKMVKRRRGHQIKPAVEKLEDRSLLSVSAFITGTEFLARSDADDNISFQEDPLIPGNLIVLENNVPLARFTSFDPTPLTEFTIEGGGQGNVIDTSALTAALLNPNGVQIIIDGGDGPDTIIGSDGFGEIIFGGDGDDTINGGAGDDVIDAGDGNDAVTGGAGNDSIKLRDGSDFAQGGLGNDTITGNDGDDTIQGENGNDSLAGGSGLDSLEGNDGDDVIEGGSNNDTIHGGIGDDQLKGNSGFDSMTGGDGNDFMEGKGNDDTMDGGDGSDEIIGGAGNDEITGGDGPDKISGSSGNDLVVGGNGDDSIFGGSGNDFLQGANDNDTIKGQGGDDTLLGGSGGDSLVGGTGNDFIQSLGASLSIMDVGTINEGNSGTTLITFAVTLGQASQETVTVDFTTADGTATAGSDYISVSGTLTYAPGETFKTIDVLLVGDTIGEGMEFFVVNLSNAVNALIITGQGRVDITDDDLTLTINDVTMAEGNMGTTNFDFTVTLSNAVSNPVLVDFTTADGTGVAGLDYTATSGTLTFSPGTSTLTITVAVLGDAVGEADDNFFVNLSNPMGATLTDAQGEGIITDDDGGPLIFPPIPDDQTYDGDGPTLPIPPDASGFTFPDNNRWTTTATNGGGLQQGDATTLTWGLVPDGTTLDNGVASDLIARLDTIYMETASGPDITNRTWFPLFQQVFDRYQAISGLTYIYEPMDDRGAFTGSPGVLGVRPDVRIGGRNIDGNSGILAFNFFPNNGDMVIDTADNFYTNTGSNSLGLRNVLAHEHGHGLGQPHTCPTDQTKLMEPSISTAYDGPQEDDTLATQRGYGDFNDSGTGNDTSALATDLGLAVSMATITETGNSIDSTTDMDFFRFSVGTFVQATITLTPIGTMYLSGPQVGGCTAGTPFDALTQSNLVLELLDSDGTTVLASANVGGIGQSETITGFSLPSTGDFFIRVAGTEDFVQMYQLDVSVLGQMGPGPGPGPVDSQPDTLIGDSGNDTIIGAGADDFIVGGSGADSLVGNGGDDSIFGGSGNDIISGGTGNDVINGQAGDDEIDSGAGDDTFVWDGDGSGIDEFISATGFNRVDVRGDDSDNTFTVSQSDEKLQVTEGSSTITLDEVITQVEINLEDGRDNVIVRSVDEVIPMVVIINGQNGRDTIDASRADLGRVHLVINGGGGNDILIGSKSSDIIDGGNGNDTILAGSGDDKLNGADGDDIIDGQEGNDQVSGGEGSDSMLGGDGDDSMFGNRGNDTMDGGLGNDTLNGGNGFDKMAAGAGDDSLLGGNNDDSMFGGGGDDTIDGGAGNDNVRGHDGDDSIRGGDGNDRLKGDGGSDTINGGDGDDTIEGNVGDDFLAGGDGHDNIAGAAGRDVLHGGDGNDSLRGGGGVDTLLGKDGDDRLDGQAGRDTVSTGRQSGDVRIPDAEFLVSLDPADDDIVNEAFMLSNEILIALDLI